MQVSMWTAYFWDLPAEDMVQILAEHCWHFGDFSFEHGLELLGRGDPVRAGQRVKDFAADMGVTFTQGHLNLKADLSHKPGTKVQAETRDSLKKWCDLFNALGITSAVLHPSDGGFANRGKVDEKWEARLENNISELVDHVRGSSLTICLENIGTTELVFSLNEKINDSQLAICLDTGHLHLAGGNSVDFINKAGKKLKALHIADNFGEHDDHLLPYAGNIKNWPEIVAALYKMGYQGSFSFEVPGESFGCPRQIREAKLDYARQLGEIMTAKTTVPGQAGC
jgi:sugar phosphate isomerase/epimerase